MCVCAFAARAHQRALSFRLVRALPGLRVSWCVFAHALRCARAAVARSRSRPRTRPCVRGRVRAACACQPLKLAG
eukprot:4550119-Pleurochrysis_carterae.AAC.1